LAVGTRLLLAAEQLGGGRRLAGHPPRYRPDAIGRFSSPACAPLGDAAVTLQALHAALRGSKVTWQPNPNLPAVRAAFAERLGRQEPPMGFLRAIRAALPDDGIYVEDVTQVGFASRLALPVFAPHTFLSPGYQDTLG
jgi:acetolactate synthase-1/2/3 large subunit